MQHESKRTVQAKSDSEWAPLFLNDTAFLSGYCSNQTKEELFLIDRNIVYMVREAAEILAHYLPHASHASPKWAPIKRTDDERDQGISLRPVIVVGVRGDDDRIWSPKVGICHDGHSIYFFTDKFLVLDYEPQLIDDWRPWRASGHSRGSSYLRLKRPVTKEISESYYRSFLKYVSDKQHDALVHMRSRNRTHQPHSGLSVGRLTPREIEARDAVRRKPQNRMNDNTSTIVMARDLEDSDINRDHKTRNLKMGALDNAYKILPVVNMDWGSQPSPEKLNTDVVDLPSNLIAMSQDTISSVCLEPTPVVLECSQTVHSKGRQRQQMTPPADTSFLLEPYLHQFIVANWERIDLGRNWKIHAEPGNPMAGVGFLNAIGRIDILAKHRSEPRWLVVELQGDKTSDVAVGQVLRHMGWVARHQALPEERVEGLVVGRKEDPQLGYLMAAAPNVRFHRYEVDFRLIPDSNHERCDGSRCENSYQNCASISVDSSHKMKKEHSEISKVSLDAATINSACGQFSEWVKRLPLNAIDEIDEVLSDLPIDPRRATADQAWRVIWDKPLFANTRVDTGSKWVEELSSCMDGAWKNWGTEHFQISKIGSGKSNHSFQISKNMSEILNTKTSVATFRLFAIQNAAVYLRRLDEQSVYPVAEFWTKPLDLLVPHLVNVLGWGWGATTVLHMLSDFGVAVKTDLHVMNSLRRLGIWLGSTNNITLNDALLVNATIRKMLDIMGKVEPKDIRRLDLQLMALSRFKVPFQ